MNFKTTILSTVAVLASLTNQGAAAERMTFDQSIKDACIVEGAAEWREQFDALTPLEEEIMAAERFGCHVLVSRSLDVGVDQLIADHGIILMDKGGIADGKEAQRAMFKSFLGAGYDLVYEPVDAKVSASEDMGWAIGMVKITSPEGDVEFSKYTAIWEKIDGVWLNVVEMRNSNGELGSKPY